MNPSSTYYIMINGKPLGPIPIDKIRQQLISGILLPGTQISADGFTWKPLEMLFDSAIASGQSANAVGLPPTGLVPYRFGHGYEKAHTVNHQNAIMPTIGNSYSGATSKSMDSGAKIALLLTCIAGLISVSIVAFLMIARARDGVGNKSGHEIIVDDIVSHFNPNPDWPAIFEKTSQSVAFIETSKRRGSGVLVGKGLIATNAHVVGDDDNVRLNFPKADPKNREACIGSVVFCDRKRDLAIVKSDVDLPFLVLGRSKAMRSGEDVSLIGFPGLHAGEAKFSSSRGTFSELMILHAISPDVEWVDLSATANPGNSGGPVINSLGQVVGLVSAGHMNGGRLIAGHVICVPSEEISLAINFIKMEKAK